jgi:NAD+ synthase
MSKTIDQKIDQIVDWLREQVEVSGTKGILVGLSGGIDSSVVANLIKRAFPENSLGVILPCKSNPKDKADATSVAIAAGIKYIEVELTETHDVLLGEIEKAVSELTTTNHQLTDANLRARLRMSTLYAVANNLGYLVAGTDNAAEVHTGYFTKYGDGGVDILPIANLPKREVFEWARHMGVPQSVIDRKPSAGLWEGQTDEEEMGVTYDAIDDYLEGKPVSDEDKAVIERMHTRTAHKRVMPPAPPAF